MDGQTIESDPKTAEYLRQKEVFERSMKDLERQKLRREASGYAVLSAVYSYEPASRGEGWMGRANKFSKLALIAAVGIIPNILVISVLLN